MTAAAPKATPFAAYQWARQGFEIVPTLRTPNGKKPVIKWGDGGLTKSGHIDAYWRKYPDAMIGVLLPKGWAVVDIDKHPGRPNGFKTLEKLGLLDKVRTGVRVITRSGGEHYWFRSDKTFVSRGMVDGVDMRSTGRIVIVPGTEGYDTPGIKKGLAGFFKRLRDAPGLPVEIETLAELKRERISDRDPDELRMEEERARQCVPYIENPDYDWDTWKKVIGALHAASDGLDWGQELAHEFSSKSAKYDYDETERAWNEVERSPYIDVGGGTLVHLARQGGMPGPGAEVSASDVFDDERPIEEQLADLSDEARDLIGDLKPPKPSWLDFSDATRWADRPPRPIRYAIEKLMPESMLTLMVGDGGAGKGILLQTAATCVAAGTPFAGFAVTSGSAVFLTGEDPDNVLHGRQIRINKELGISWSDLGRLRPVSVTDEDISLFRDGKTTMLLDRIAKRLTRINDLRLLVIDSAAIVYDDDEIKRRSVKAFCLGLNRLAAHLGVAVVLIVHTNKAGDISGSTGWSNHARSVLKLEKGDGSKTTLIQEKSNHSKAIEKVTLNWSDDGVLAAVSAEDKEAGEQSLKDAAFAMVCERWKKKQPASNAPSSPYYLPKLMAEANLAKQGHGKQAMLALEGEGRIEPVEFKRRGGALKPCE